MRKLFTFALIIFSFSSFGQTKKVTISKKKIGPLTCEFTNNINLEKGDTLPIIYMGFKNEKYSHISDFKSIVLSPKIPEPLNQFVKDLNTALPELGTKAELSWDREDYSLSLYDFSNELYLRNETGAYTTLNKFQVQDLINWLKEIGY